MTQTTRLLPATIAVLLPALSVAAPTAGQSAKPSSCAVVQTIDSWKDADELTVILETSPRRRYKVTFTAPCPDVKRGFLALIQRLPSAGTCLSPGDSIVFARRVPVSHRKFGFDERCAIKTIAALPVEANDASAPN